MDNGLLIIAGLIVAGAWVMRWRRMDQQGERRTHWFKALAIVAGVGILGIFVYYVVLVVLVNLPR